jgi:hypothetical protein
MKIFFFATLILLKSFCFGQIKNKFFIQDKETHEKIKNATIYLQRQQILVAADTNGVLFIYAQPNDIIKITSIGYKETSYKVLKNLDTIFLVKNISTLEAVTIQPSKLLGYNNKKSNQNSQRVLTGSHFFTSFSVPCSYTTISGFTLYQHKFIQDVSLTLAFYKDTVSFPGKRISPFYISTVVNPKNGKITFKFEPPLVIENEEKLFFEIARIKWPTEIDFMDKTGDVSIKFTFKDKKNYTLAYFTNYSNAAYIMDKHIPRVYVDSSSINQYPNHGNPIFEFKYRCKDSDL